MRPYTRHRGFSASPDVRIYERGYLCRSGTQQGAAPIRTEASQFHAKGKEAYNPERPTCLENESCRTGRKD